MVTRMILSLKKAGNSQRIPAGVSHLERIKFAHHTMGGTGCGDTSLGSLTTGEASSP